MKSPKQAGFLNLHGGSMGTTTFVRMDGVFTTREKLTRSKQRTEVHLGNESEFGIASKAGASFRYAMAEVKPPKNREVINRVQKIMRKITQLDKVSARGKRNVAAGDRSLLLGFEFNIKAPFRGSFNVRFTTGMNRQTGELTINIPSIIPKSVIKAPLGTTHFKIVSAGASINFAERSNVSAKDTFKSDLIPWDWNPTSAISVVFQMPLISTDTLFLALGVQYFKDSGPEMEMVKFGKGDSLCVVGVS